VGLRARSIFRFSIELYAVNINTDDLARAIETAESYSGDVFFSYDASNARDVLRDIRNQDE